MLPEKKIEKYLRNAKIVSLLSDNKKTRVGCVVVYKNY
jgi:deoxycytidylate deaminase